MNDFLRHISKLSMLSYIFKQLLQANAWYPHWHLCVYMYLCQSCTYYVMHQCLPVVYFMSCTSFERFKYPEVTWLFGTHCRNVITRIHYQWNSIAQNIYQFTVTYCLIIWYFSFANILSNWQNMWMWFLSDVVKCKQTGVSYI